MNFLFTPCFQISRCGL